MSPSRDVRMLIDIARAHAHRRQVTESVAALQKCGGITPELVTGHYLPSQIISDPLTMQDPPGLELRALAVRLGVTRGIEPGMSAQNRPGPE